MDNYNVNVDLGGKELQLATGMVARQAHGSTLVRFGESVALVTVTRSHRETDRDYFPLMVDFEEKMYAAGKFPGGFLKREGRSSDHAIVTARLIDRAMRPLFPSDYKYEVQIVCLALSSDMENPLDVCALCGASVALSISEIPFAEPVAAVRVGRIDGEFIVNPTFDQMDEGDMEIVVAGTEDAIMMVEGEASELPESVFLEAIDFARGQISKIIEVQKDIIEKMKRPKMDYNKYVPNEDLAAKVKEYSKDKIAAALDGLGKEAREDAIRDLMGEVVEKFATSEDGKVDSAMASEARDFVDAAEKEEMRRIILKKGIRADGRKLDEIREISSSVGLLPRTHGSGLFTRGQTQVLSIVTLGTKGDAQRVDGISHDVERRYMHHYNFPPFSVGEVKPMRGPSRRDIGHGTLAERALIKMIPEQDDFPFAIRVVSEVLESNGSSSMASVCGSTLSLMDAGVPIKDMVSGIAMGLIIEDDDNYSILTDIQGLEDHHGDMDFKVAGTSKGITAVQMDIKVKGIPKAIMEDAMGKAREARMKILDLMKQTISEPNKEMSPYAPMFQVVHVEIDKIGTVIGPGGKTVRGIVEETGAKIDIEDDGSIYIYAKDKESGAAARQMVEALTENVEVGTIYKGVVKRIVNFGAFVEILPGTEGLVHISQLADRRVEKVEDIVNIGDEVKVKVREVDDFDRVNLTMLLDGPDKPRPSGRDRNDRGDRKFDRDKRRPPRR